MKKSKIFDLIAAAGIVVICLLSISAKNSRAKETIKAINPGIQKQSSAKLLPDLKIEKVTLDGNCDLVIGIRNAGPGSVPRETFKNCVVQVRLGQYRENFYLGTPSKRGKPPVDPNGILSNPGGSITYNTGIRVEENTKAAVYVDYGNTVKETKDSNNRSGTIALKPNCSRSTVSTSKTAIGASPSNSIRSGQTIQKTPEKIPAATRRIRKPGASMKAVPRIDRAFDLILRGNSLIVLEGRSFGNSADGRSVRLNRSNTAGNPVMSYFLNVRSWNSGEIIAAMPDQLANPSNPSERNTHLNARQGRFTLGLYIRGENRWLGNQVPVQPGTGDVTDSDRDGHDAVRFMGDDCDDQNGNRYPGNAEVGDFEGNDEDCNPNTIGRLDVDGDGYTDHRVWNDPVQFPGMSAGGVRGDDCDDSRADVHPGQVEVCNNRDDNCDGNIDEGVAVTFYRDKDRDLFGDPSSPVRGCYSDLESGLVTNRDDCNDSDPGINPREGNCP